MANYFQRFVDDEEERRRKFGASNPNFDHFRALSPQPEPEEQAHPSGGQVPFDPRPAEDRTRSFQPLQTSLWDRVKEVAVDTFHHSPAGALTNWVAGHLPSTEDYQPGGDNSQAAQQARAAQRVQQSERDYREQYAGRTADDPWRRPDGTALGNAARFAADAAGMFGGGAISDPTNAVAPGRNILMKMLGQAALGGGVDAGLQGVEMRQGVRDNFDPLEVGTSAAGGAALTGVAEGAAPAARGLRDWWHGRGVDTGHLSDADLVSGSLDGSIDPHTRLGPDDIDSILRSAGAAPKQFSTPEMAAQAAQRVQGISPPLNIGPDELARQAQIRGDIQSGLTDPSFAPQPPPRTMPPEVPIIGTPDGLNIRGDDMGGMQGFDRKQFADAAALARGRIAAEQDPTAAAILNDPSANHQQKIASIWDRLEKQAQADQQGVEQSLQLPETPASPWTQPTPHDAARAASGADNMTRFIMDRLEGGSKRTVDTGGETRFGISKKGNPDVDVGKLDQAGADRLYHDRYYKPMGLDGLPEDLKLVAYDAAINHGVPRAKQMLAAADGSASKLIDLRRAEYARLAAANPEKYGKFVNGWENRLKELEGKVGAETPYRVGPRPDDLVGDNPAHARGYEDTTARASPTNEERQLGRFNSGERIADEPMATGDSSKPFKAVQDDPADQPGFWEAHADRMHEEFVRKNEERAQEQANSGGQEKVKPSDDPSQRFGANGYGQKPFQDGDAWRMTEGHIADKDGKPVAFRNAKEAARWAAKNQMGGDFELHSWGTNSKRVVLRRRENSNYGEAPPRAGPAEPPAGRSEDPSQRALGSPESASPPPRPSDTPEPPIAAERPAGEHGAVSERPAPPEPQARPAVPAETRAPVTGKSEQVVTPRGRSIDTQFEVREARDLVSSDHPAFDPELQPRDRAGRSSSDAQVAEIASRLDPEQLHSSRLASQGAPIVGPDRMVESGNGRVQAIRRAYDQHPEKMDAYKGMIRDQGLDPSGFDQPVLVRRRTTDLEPGDRGAFVREANERDTMQMSSPEQAKADAGALSDDVLSLHRGGSITEAGNRDFVRAWVDKVASPAERNTLMQADGSLSQDGIRRVRSSLLAKAFDDADLVSRITEDPDTNIKAIGSALTDTAPAFAQLRQKVASGDLPKEFDIGRNVGEMASMISRARSEGKPLADMLKQDDIFAGSTDPVTEGLTRLMFKGDELRQPRSAADMQEGLRFYTQEAAKAKSGSLFGDAAPAAKPVDILKAAAAKLDKKAAERSGKGATLFRRATNLFQEERPASRKLSEDLRSVADSHPNVQTRSLAGRLADLVGDAEVKYGKVDSEGLRPGEVAKGRTDAYSDGRVEASVHSDRDPETLLHEAVHVATLSRYGQLVDEAGKGTPAAGPIAELEQLRLRAQKAFDRRPHDPTGEVKFGLENTDEFLAHGLTSKAFQGFLQRHSTANLWGRFRDWVRGILGMDPKADTLLDRTLQSGSRLMKAMEDGGEKPASERTSLFSKAADPDKSEHGHIARAIDAVLDVKGLKSDAGALKAKIGSPVKAAKGILREMDRFGSATAYSADGALRTLSRHFDAPTITKLADMFQARAGAADGTGRTYDEAIKRGLGRFRSKLDGALEPHIGDKAAMGRIRDLLADPAKRMSFKPAEREAAVKIRDLLKEVIEYRKAAGEDIGEVKDYFPRVIDSVAVANDRPKFTAAAERLYRSIGVEDPKAAAENWLLRIMDTHAGLDGGLEFAGGTKPSSAKAREFGAQADRVLKGFYQENPLLVLSDYITGSIRRAEQTRRFGPKGVVGSDERHAWMKEHGEKSQWDVMREQIRSELRDHGGDASGVMDRVAGIRDTNLGKLTPFGARASSVVSTIHAWNQLSSLERVTLSSLGDLAMGFVRGGAGYGVRHLAKTVSEVARAITPFVDHSPSDARRWAEGLGTVGSNTASALIQARMDGAPGAMQYAGLLDKFYGKVGLKQLTEGGRTAATENGRIFVETLAGDLKSESARTRARAAFYLRELGVSEPEAFGAWLRQGGPKEGELAADRGHAADYATAVIRFADQSILMPTRGQKPAWASHPVGSLVFALQSYAAGFTQNVLKRVGRTAVEAVKTKDPKMLTPAAGMVVLAGVTALQDYLRGALFGTTKEQREESSGGYALRIADRAGFTGLFSPFLNGLKGLRYHRSMSQSLQGAVIGRAADATDATAGLFVGNKDGTNSAERKAASMLYDLGVNPALNAFGAGRVKGWMGTAVILGTGNKRGGIAPADKDAFVDELGGEKEED